MSKPLVVPPNVETIVGDYLRAALLARGQDVTVGVVIPPTWSSSTKPHVQVALDGTEVRYPALWKCSVRVTCWAAGTTTAQALAGLAHGLLLSHPGDVSVGSIRPLTGTIPARDPDTGAQLASVSVLVNLRGSTLT